MTSVGNKVDQEACISRLRREGAAGSLLTPAFNFISAPSAHLLSLFLLVEWRQENLRGKGKSCFKMLPENVLSLMQILSVYQPPTVYLDRRPKSQTAHANVWR